MNRYLLLQVSSLLLSACSIKAVRTQHDPTWLLRTTRDVVEFSQAADPASAPIIRSTVRLASRWDEQVELHSGLPQRLELLAATALSDGRQRVRQVERLFDEARDDLLRKLTAHMLQRDDAYLARRLEQDETYSLFAGLLNSVWRGGYAVLNGNPLGFLSTLVGAVEDITGDGELEARERKLAALHRRLLLADTRDQAAPELVEQVHSEIETLGTATFEQELRLAERLRQSGRLDAAAAHLHVAGTLRPNAPEVVRLRERIDSELTERSDRLSRSLDIDPVEPDLVRMGTSITRSYLSLVDALLLGADADAKRFGERIEVQASRLGHVALRRSVTAALAMKSRRVDRYLDVARALEEHRSRRWRFVFNGRRPERDPLLRYQADRAESRRSYLDAAASLLYLPGTLIRLLSFPFWDPLDDQPVVDALSRYVREVADGPRREDAWRALVRRYRDRNEPAKALGMARERGAAEDLIAELEDEAARLRLDRARTLGREAARQRALKALSDAFPASEAAGEARRLLAESAGEEKKPGLLLPDALLRRAAGELGISADLLDGRRENGEVVGKSTRLDGDLVAFSTMLGDVRLDRSVRVDSVVRERLLARLAEWRWRQQALAAETYMDLHDGVPVELRAGIGTGGFAIYPALLPESYRLADRSLFE